MIKVVWVAVFLAVMWLFDWNDLLADELGSIGAGILTFAAIFPFIFFLNLLSSPARIDAEQGEIISHLKLKIHNEDQRQNAINTLWEVRAEGVNLRAEVVKLEDYPDWRKRYLAWEQRVLSVAGKVSPNLEKWLATLDRIRRPPNFGSQSCCDDHQQDRKLMSEITLRLQEFLEADMLNRDISRYEP